MTNPWIKHVEEFRKKHPNMSYKDVLQKARATYKPIAETERVADFSMS